MKEILRYLRDDSNLLVWGVGYDSIMWNNMTCLGRTVFLETDHAWLKKIKKTAAIEAYLIHHEKERSQSKIKYENNPGSNAWLDLSAQLPRNVSDQKWDIIIVDGPPAFNAWTEGRHRALYTSRNLIRKGGVVFVDDCQRPHEQYFMRKFLNSQPDRIVKRTISANSRCTFLM